MAERSMRKTIQCPFCFESVDIWLDPTDEGSMIRDCDVCCNPWQLNIERSRDGGVRIEVSRAY